MPEQTGITAARFKPRNTITEFCEISGLARATVYKRIASGLLRVTKDGARTFVTGAEIERYLAACESGATP
jgi:hypothetical protein